MSTSAALLGSFVSLKTMADGTPRVTFDLQCDLKSVADMGFAPGASVAIAMLNEKAANNHMQKEIVKDQAKDNGEFGHYYKCLYVSGWFYNPAVCENFSIPQNYHPDMKVKLIKDELHDRLNVDSLASVNPVLFATYISNRGIYHTLPLSLRILNDS
jgi:hypothetical protein